MAVVRPVQAEDVPAIHALISGIFADYGYVLDVQNEDTHLQAPGEYFRHTGGEFWVVEENGQLIATAAVYLHADAGELKSLYVRRDQRRCGLGRRLTELAIEHARRAGRMRMFLWSDTLFTDAHRLYESMGFVRTDIRNIRATNEFSEYRYERALP